MPQPQKIGMTNSKKSRIWNANHRQKFKDNNVSTKSKGKFVKVYTDIGWKEKGEEWMKMQRG